VHNERCTPGSGAGLVETTEGNFGMAPRPHVHVRCEITRTQRYFISMSV